MTDNEYGPFDTERQALATRSAALIRAAFDAHPGVGASVPECLRVMTDACEAHGVALGMLDRSFLKGVAWGETFYTVSLAGVIARAYQAGLAAREGVATEYGVRFTLAGNTEESAVPDEAGARRAVESMRRNHPDFEPIVMVQREAARPAGPWTPVPEAEAHDG